MHSSMGNPGRANYSHSPAASQKASRAPTHNRSCHYSSLGRLRDCLFIVAAAVVAAFVPRTGRTPAQVQPAFVAQPDASSRTIPAPSFELAPRVSAGRLIRVFGAIPLRAVCRNAHWQWADLSHQWFAGADCSGAQLQSARLIGTNFRGANLAGAQMQDAMMWYANLDSARLTRANLRHADLARASLRQASLEGADLRRAIFKHSNMTQANLLGANMRDANLTAANLQGAILTGLVMDGVNFTRANLRGADLSRADLRHALGLEIAQLKLANTDSNTRMPDGIPATVDLPSQ